MTTKKKVEPAATGLDQHQGTDLGPFRRTARTYLRRGWSPIALPANEKSPPPTGWTGYLGERMTKDLPAKWLRGKKNIGLRLPETVIGIDVDHYSTDDNIKRGGDTFADAVERLGPLPPTWRSTSRLDDDVSGIRYYRVPAGRCWADKLGPDVEIIHHGHRYAVVAPSLHPEGREYVWFCPCGDRPENCFLGCPTVPAVKGVPRLPEAWVEELDQGSLKDRPAKAVLADSEVGAWLAALPGDEPCAAVAEALQRAQAALREGGSRHDTGRSGVMALIRLAEEGHEGVPPALDALEDTWLDMFGGGGRQPEEHEWGRMVTGGVTLALGDPTKDKDKGCCGMTVVSDDYAGLTGIATRVLAAHGGEPVFKKLKSVNPSDLADRLLNEVWSDNATSECVECKNCKAIRSWTGAMYEHHGAHWSEIPDKHLDASVQRLLAGALHKKKVDGKFVWAKYKPSTGAISEIVKQIELKTLRHSMLPTNHWDYATEHHEVGAGGNFISFRNGLLDVAAGGDELTEHDRAFFNTFSMQFDFDPDATAPLWVATLEQWFPGDQQAKDTLEEIMGFLLLGGTEHDKFFPLLGDQRSGKGTVMRVLRSMLGDAYTTQSMDELGDRFGKEDLIGMKVCHISEAVSTRDGRRVVSTIKSISGRDEGMAVKRKGTKSTHNVVFEVRFVFTGNNEVEFPDESGVIIDRMVPVYFGQSFYGRENGNLTEQLIAESSGIFNRLRAAYARLCDRGKFITPASAEPMIAALRRKAAPEQAWLVDTFEEAPKEYVRLDDVVASFQLAMPTLVAERAAQMKVSSLLSKYPTDRITLDSGERARVIYGIKFRKEPETGPESDPEA